MFFPEAHDLFKLVYRNRNSPHPCPDTLRELFPKHADAILQRKLYFLNHHCFTPRPGQHFCKTSSFYPLDCRWILLSIADGKAAAISRWLEKKELEDRKSKPWSSYMAVRVWRRTERREKPVDSGIPIVEELATGKAIEGVLGDHTSEMKERSEDINRPFASLWTHSELTKWWFQFLRKNMDYFGVPDSVEDEKGARRIRGKIESKPLYFIRYRIFPNRHLSRLSDRLVIHMVSKVHEGLISALPGAETLYGLGFERLVVVCPPSDMSSSTDVGRFVYWIKKRFADTEVFSTNYRVELTAVRALLGRKRLPYPFKTLFAPYASSAYPKLPEVIRPSTDDEGAGNAILCELCQMAPAVCTREKATELEQVRTREHLCEGCLVLRERQGSEEKESLGREYARWEDDPEAHAVYIHIDLHMPRLWKAIEENLRLEYELARTPSDRDLGFSPVKEFLKEFDSFLKAFSSRVFSLPAYSEKATHVEILENLMCLRMSESSELSEIMAIYLNLIKEYFPLWMDRLPFDVTICFGRVKYPFYEYWRILDQAKSQSINIYKLRSAALELKIGAWEKLQSLELERRPVSRFLHRLTDLENRTGGSRLVLDTEIVENRRLLGDAYFAFTTRVLTAKDILAYYKIFRKDDNSGVNRS